MSTGLTGPAIVLTQNQPVEIAVMNTLKDATAIHWHGIELESYYDGVPGWGGVGDKRAPPVEPGETFVARMIPPRAGTFIYHTHWHDEAQLTGGVHGAADRPAAGPDLRSGHRQGVPVQPEPERSVRRGDDPDERRAAAEHDAAQGGHDVPLPVHEHHAVGREPARVAQAGGRAGGVAAGRQGRRRCAAGRRCGRRIRRSRWARRSTSNTARPRRGS